MCIVTLELIETDDRPAAELICLIIIIIVVGCPPPLSPYSPTAHMAAPNLQRNGTVATTLHTKNLNARVTNSRPELTSIHPPASDFSFHPHHNHDIFLLMLLLFVSSKSVLQQEIMSVQQIRVLQSSPSQTNKPLSQPGLSQSTCESVIDFPSSTRTFVSIHLTN